MSTLVNRGTLKPIEQSRREEEHREREREIYRDQKPAWTGWCCPGCKREHITEYALFGHGPDGEGWLPTRCSKLQHLLLSCDDLACTISVRVSLDPDTNPHAKQWAKWSTDKRKATVARSLYYSRLDGHKLESGQMMPARFERFAKPHPPFARYDPWLDVEIQPVEPIGDSVVRPPDEVTLRLPSGVVNCGVVASQFSTDNYTRGRLEVKIDQPTDETLREEVLRLIPEAGSPARADFRANPTWQIQIQVRRGFVPYTWRPSSRKTSPIAERDPTDLPERPERKLPPTEQKPPPPPEAAKRIDALLAAIKAEEIPSSTDLNEATLTAARERLGTRPAGAAPIALGGDEDLEAVVWEEGDPATRDVSLDLVLDLSAGTRFVDTLPPDVTGRTTLTAGPERDRRAGEEG